MVVAWQGLQVLGGPGVSLGPLPDRGHYAFGGVPGTLGSHAGLVQALVTIPAPVGLGARRRTPVPGAVQFR